MRRIRWMSLITVLVLVVAACGEDTTTDATEAPAAEETTVPEGEPTTTAAPDTTEAEDEPTTTPDTTAPPSTKPPEGTDGPPLVVNGQAITPELTCAGVDGAVVFIDDGIRYIAGFENGTFLRVILDAGEVLETTDVTLTDDPSGAFPRGILQGEFDEAAITMYLDDDLDDCPELP